jgi:hypothetical protein
VVYAAAVFRSLPVLVALLALAPMQCGGKSQDPSLRTDDNPGDALYDLAQDFRAKGNAQSYRDTLRFIVARYPSSRRAVTAKLELEEDGGLDASP